jgi:hypothetical protein
MSHPPTNLDLTKPRTITRRDVIYGVAQHGEKDFTALAGGHHSKSGYKTARGAWGFVLKYIPSRALDELEEEQASRQRLWNDARDGRATLGSELRRQLVAEFGSLPCEDCGAHPGMCPGCEGEDSEDCPLCDGSGMCQTCNANPNPPPPLGGLASAAENADPPEKPTIPPPMAVSSSAVPQPSEPGPDSSSATTTTATASSPVLDPAGALALAFFFFSAGVLTSLAPVNAADPKGATRERRIAEDRVYVAGASEDLKWLERTARAFSAPL